MEKEIEEQIEDIIETLKCQKDFECYKSGFKRLCRAKDIGLESFITCLGTDPLDCKFSILFGGLFLSMSASYLYK